MATENELEKKVSLLLGDLSSLEEYINDLFVFAPLPICFVSLRGMVFEANPAFEKISNCTLTDIIGTPVTGFFKEGEAERLQADTLKNGTIEGREMIFFPKNREGITVQAFTRTRQDEEGRAVGFFLSLFDLTRIKETEEGIRQTQRALLNILEDTEEARQVAETEKSKTEAIITNLADGLFVFDKENNLTLINPQAEAFFEIRPEEVVGKSILELSSIPAFEPLANLLGKEIKGVFRKEVQIRDNLILEVSTLPMIKGGEILGSLIILHDITREKMIEKMKTEFVSLTAHQLRTPLSAVKWTLRMLLDGDLGNITEEQRSFLEKTYNSNERMIDLINDLLNVTRIEEGRYLYRPTLADIEPVVQSVIGSYKGEFERKKIRFEFKKPEKKTGLVLIDEEKIRLAIQNLIDNAIAYSQSGDSVAVSLKYVNQKEVELSVKDTGVGIPKDQQERIFTKFFRGANAIRMETEGSGLGLFITKNIIEAHGGRIWFESEENKGTTFYLTIPIKEEFEEFLEGF